MVEMIRELKNNDGLTLKKYKSVQYKTGYQVADYGLECGTAEAAAAAVKSMHGSCGIWFSEGIYYIDHSFRVATKKEALIIGKEHNQISILKWSTMELVYC